MFKNHNMMIRNKQQLISVIVMWRWQYHVWMKCRWREIIVTENDFADWLNINTIKNTATTTYITHWW